MADATRHPATPSRWESSRTRPARSRSSGSPTPTSPGWSSATSTPGAACWGGSWSCISRTARPTTPSPPPRRRSSSSEDQVDVIFGGIYSSTRQAIKGPAVVEGKTLYIYPEQYEGQESDPLIFCTGPVPAQQVDPFIPWLMRETGREDVLPAVRRLHLAARAERARPGGRRRPTAARSSARSTSRSTTWTTAATVERIIASGADVVFNTIVPPGVTPFFEELHDVRLHEPRRAARLHVLRRELPEHGAGRARRGAVRLPRLLPGRRRPVQPRSCSSSTTRSIPATRSSPAAAPARACTAGCGSGPRR